MIVQYNTMLNCTQKCNVVIFVLVFPIFFSCILGVHGQVNKVMHMTNSSNCVYFISRTSEVVFTGLINQWLF